jgi:hypothetical protein
LKNTSSDEFYGFLIEATASVDFSVEVNGGTVLGVEVDSFSNVDFVNSGFEGPEVVDIRIKNTTTAASGTADAILGSGGR